MKKIFTLIAACALTIGASAQTAKLSAAYDSETKSINVDLTNDADVRSFTFKYVLPEGTTLATEDGESLEWITDRVSSLETSRKKWTVKIMDAKFVKEGHDGPCTMIAVYDAPKAIAAGEGTVWEMPLETVSKGTVIFAEAQVVLNGVETNLPDFDLDLSGTAISSVKAASEEGTIYNISGQVVNKAQKGIFIQNGKKVVK